MTIPRPVVSSTTIFQGPIFDARTGTLTYAGMQWFRSVQDAVNNSLSQNGDLIGNIDPMATVGNRPEGIGVTLENIDDTGVVSPNGIDFQRAYLHKTTDYIGDGTGSPLAGGKASYTALVASPPLAAAHKWISSFNPATGMFVQTQPDYSDLTNPPVLPATTTVVAHQWLTSYDATTGNFGRSTIAANDLSNGVSGTGATVLASGPSLSSVTLVNGLLQTGASVAVAALSTNVVLTGSGASSGLLHLRDSTLGGSALFLIDPVGGSQLIGASQITGITSATNVVWTGGNWNVNLGSGSVPRTIDWAILG